MEFEGNTKIMPFNVEEDLEEGHFDTDGNFIFNKVSYVFIPLKICHLSFLLFFLIFSKEFVRLRHPGFLSFLFFFLFRRRQS